MFVIANIQSFTSQIFGVVGPLGENLNFLVRWDLTFKQILSQNPKIKLCSVRALKRYLNKKNLIQGRVMESIQNFSPQIFETYFGKELWVTF